MRRPDTGWLRLVYVSGMASGWQRVDEADLDGNPNWVQCQGDIKGEVSVEFSRLYVASIQYATDAEKEAIVKNEAEKVKLAKERTQNEKENR